MAIALEAIELGVDVLKPLAEHSRYDLVFEIGGRLLPRSVQVGALKERRGPASAPACSSSAHTERLRPNKYEADEIDFVAAYCHDLGTCYLVPFDRVDRVKSGIQLRLSPPRNGQRAAVH